VLVEEDGPVRAASADPEAGAGVVGALFLLRLELGRTAGPVHRGKVLEGARRVWRAEGAVVLGRLPELAAVVHAEVGLADLGGGRHGGREDEEEGEEKARHRRL